MFLSDASTFAQRKPIYDKTDGDFSQTQSIYFRTYTDGDQGIPHPKDSEKHPHGK